MEWLASLRLVAKLIGVVLLADLLYTVGAAGLATKRLGAGLEAASAAFAHLDVRRAAGHSRSAADWASFAASLGARPSAMLLRGAPFIGDEVNRVDELADATAALTDHADALVGDVAAIAGDDAILDRLVTGPRVDVAAIEEVAGVVESHSGALDSSLRRVEATARRSVLATALAGKGVWQRAQLMQRSLEQVEDTLRVLPALVGADSARRYLLVFRSPSEARGGGGLPGVVGTLEARDGRLDVGRLRAARDLLDGVATPRRLLTSDVARTYGRSTVTDWRNVNQSPNFEVTAPVMLDLYRRASGVALDGVISVDPLVLAHMAPAVGGARGAGWDVVVTRDNARRVLLHDLYRHFDGEEDLQNRYLAGLVDDVWERALAPATDPAVLLDQLVQATAKQHLQVYMADAAEQRVLAGMGASGATLADPGTQVVFHNNWGGNKIDFFLRREIETTIRFSAGSDAQVTTRVVLENDVPPAELERPSTVVTSPAFGRRREAAVNRMVLHVLLPEGAELRGASVDGARTVPDVGRDGGREVVSEFLEVPPQGRAEVVVRYDWPVPDHEPVRFTMVPQATVRPDRYSVRLLDGHGKLVRPLRGENEGQLKIPAAVLWEVG